MSKRKTIDVPAGYVPKRDRWRDVLPFFVISNLFRRPQPSPDGRSEPDADLLSQGWRACARDERGNWVYAPPSSFSRWWSGS